VPLLYAGLSSGFPFMSYVSAHVSIERPLGHTPASICNASIYWVIGQKGMARRLAEKLTSRKVGAQQDLWPQWPCGCCDGRLCSRTHRRRRRARRFYGVVRGSQRYLPGGLPAKIQIQRPLINPPHVPLPGYSAKLAPAAHFRRYLYPGGAY
jgi:hypothetical protein